MHCHPERSEAKSRDLLSLPPRNPTSNIDPSESPQTQSSPANYTDKDASKGATRDMNAGQLQSLKDLIEFLKQQEVGEFELEQEDLKVRLSFIGQGSASGNVDMGQLAHLLQQAPRPAPTPSTPLAGTIAASSHAAPAHAPAPASTEEAGLHIVKSPIVGTFYEASAPGAEPFVKIGDQVESGQVICIVEAMKLMNEIECDAPGEIVKRMVASGQPVEYGQPLFAIRPR